MLDKPKATLLYPLFVLVLFFAGNMTGCNVEKIISSTLTTITPSTILSTTDTPFSTFSIFEIKPDDIRFSCIKHPLYRLEYPLIFELIDVNTMNDYPISCAETEVLFYVQEQILPKPELAIIVQKPDYWGYHNAREKLEHDIALSQSAASITTNNATVFGIPAYYEESFFNMEESPSYPACLFSSRSCFFDYAGMIWEVRINWYYNDAEPPEVSGYFSDVIDTFKILE